MIIPSIYTIILGCLAGLFGGALGQSGAELMLPGLILFNIVPDFKTAAGTVLLTVLPPLSLLAVMQYYKRGQTNMWFAFLLVVAYFFASYFGSRITKDFSDKTLSYAVSIYFITIGCLFLLLTYYGFDVNKSKSNKTTSGFTSMIKWK